MEAPRGRAGGGKRTPCRGSTRAEVLGSPGRALGGRARLVRSWRGRGQRGSMALSSFLPEAAVLSARNQFKGTVKSVKLGNVMAEVVVTVGGIEIVSVITRTSAEQMKLQPGVEVTAVIK